MASGTSPGDVQIIKIAAALMQLNSHLLVYVQPIFLKKGTSVQLSGYGPGNILVTLVTSINGPFLEWGPHRVSKFPLSIGPQSWGSLP